MTDLFYFWQAMANTSQRMLENRRDESEEYATPPCTKGIIQSWCPEPANAKYSKHKKNGKCMKTENAFKQSALR